MTATPNQAPTDEQGQPGTGSAYELFQRAHPGRGKLRVQVSTARGTFPVPGALVEVTRDFGGVRRMLYKNTTNTSGIVERLVLPALPADYSQYEPTAGNSGTEYQVSVYHPAFVPLVDSTVEIYDRIETILPVALQPLAR
ncbi:MAG: hypothetical protein E7426_02105 [Ruminococcaceae bacterium]|nr:hypothetical protein [Oscillospiraceae bacterium]